MILGDGINAVIINDLQECEAALHGCESALHAHGKDLFATDSNGDITLAWVPRRLGCVVRFALRAALVDVIFH